LARFGGGFASLKLTFSAISRTPPPFFFFAATQKARPTAAEATAETDPTSHPERNL